MRVHGGIAGGLLGLAGGMAGAWASIRNMNGPREFQRERKARMKRNAMMLLAMIGVCLSQAVRAETYTAVMNGAWNDNATWGVEANGREAATPPTSAVSSPCSCLPSARIAPSWLWMAGR
jgi:hypothetical protein